MSNNWIKHLAATGIVVATLLPSLSAGAATVTPGLVACPTSGQAYVISNETQTLEGIGTTYEDHNAGSNSVTQSVTFAHSSTYGGSVSISGTADVNFIISSVSASVGFTVGENVTNSVSQTVGLTIPAGRYGIIQQAVVIVTTVGTYGTYEGGSSNLLSGCALAGATTVTTSLSRENYQAVESTGTATSPTPPWPQA